MGTYTNLALKDRSEKNILRVNAQLDKLGIWEQEVHNSVPYGAFTSRQQLREDARFMNEDPEGLKQCSHQPRPITANWLESFFWNKTGFLVVKLSGGTETDILLRLYSVTAYCLENNLIDEKESEYFRLEDIREYIDIDGIWDDVESAMKAADREAKKYQCDFYSYKNKKINKYVIDCHPIKDENFDLIALHSPEGVPINKKKSEQGIKRFYWQ